MASNIDSETGIAYGVVSMNILNSWVWDEFIENGKNISDEAAFEEAKAEFIAAQESPEWADYLLDRGAEDALWEEIDCDEPEYTLESDGMSLGISWLGGAPMVWVFKSAECAMVSECSPCVPNAGDIQGPGNSGNEGTRAYTLPAEWFGND